MSMYSQISISLSLEQIHRIDQYAQKFNMSRSQFLRTIVRDTIEAVDYNSSFYQINKKPSLREELELKINKSKLELRGLEYQLDILKDQGLDYD